LHGRRKGKGAREVQPKDWAIRVAVKKFIGDESVRFDFAALLADAFGGEVFRTFRGLRRARFQLYTLSMLPTEFKGVTAVTKANIYFDGRVVSHSILFPDQSRKTLGLIYPGQFHFGTDKAERMEIIAGQCTVKLDGQTAVKTHGAGDSFEVPARSGFDIGVNSGICEYICSFL
jgi:hypothetical protein